jgi:site-specific DNA-methyltransferase (adenine-specific)
MDKNTQKIMFSSDKQDWTTPQNIYDQLDKEFGFSTDVASSEENHKAPKYFTREDSGLDKQWKGACFMNPPYNEMAAWIEKAYEESLHGSTVVALIPSRTDTRYFHDFCMRASEIRFIKGRLKFGNGANTAPFPSAIVVFENNHKATPNCMAYEPVEERRPTQAIYTYSKPAIKTIEK